MLKIGNYLVCVNEKKYLYLECGSLQICLFSLHSLDLSSDAPLNSICPQGMPAKPNPELF